MNIFIFIVFFTAWTVISTNDESLFSLACSYVDKTCHLYKIDINQSNNHDVSNEIAKWNQTNVADSFGSVAGFKNRNVQYIVMMTDYNNHAHLINISNPAQSPSAITMKTSCTQPMYSLSSVTPANRFFSFKCQCSSTKFSCDICYIQDTASQWILKQIQSNLLSNFAYSTHLNAPVSDCSLGGICVLNLETYQWDSFLSISNFHGFIDWTFSNDQQTMYFISKQNVTVVDLSNKSSFHYRVLPLIEQSGNINGIEKTVVFSAE